MAKKYSCYDCGSDRKGHHTKQCDMAGARDKRDLENEPGTQYYVGRNPIQATVNNRLIGRYRTTARAWDACEAHHIANGGRVFNRPTKFAYIKDRVRMSRRRYKIATIITGDVQ